MEGIEFAPQEPSADLREPTRIDLRIPHLAPSDVFKIATADEALESSLSIAHAGESTSRVLIVDLRQVKDAPAAGDHLVSVSITRLASIVAAASIRLRINDTHSCLGLGGIAPKITVASDGSVVLRISVFNRCGHSLSVDMRASWGDNGLDVSLPSLSIGPRVNTFLEARISVPGSDLVDLLRNGHIPDDLTVSLSNKGGAGAELMLQGSDFKLSRLPVPIVRVLDRIRTSSRLASAVAGAVVVLGVAGLFWWASDDPDPEESIGRPTVETTADPVDRTDPTVGSTTSPATTTGATTTPATAPATSPVTMSPATTTPMTDAVPPTPAGSLDSATPSPVNIDGYVFEIATRAQVVRNSAFPATVELFVHEGGAVVGCGVDSAAEVLILDGPLDAPVFLTAPVITSDPIEMTVVQELLLCGPDEQELDRTSDEVALVTTAPRFDIEEVVVIGDTSFAAAEGLSTPTVPPAELVTIDSYAGNSFGVRVALTTSSPRPFEAFDLDLVLDGLDGCTRGPNDGPHDGTDRVSLSNEESYDATGGRWEKLFTVPVPYCEVTQIVDGRITVAADGGVPSNAVELSPIRIRVETFD